MKNKPIRMALVGALAAGAMFAQTATDSGQLAKRTEQPQGWRAAGRAERRAHFAERMANYLNLTPEQRAQAKQVMAAAREQSKPLRQELKQNRAALMNAVKTANDAQIDKLSREQAPLLAKMASIRAHAFEKIYASLTPEQKAKADTMRQSFMSRHHAHQREQAQKNS